MLWTRAEFDAPERCQSSERPIGRMGLRELCLWILRRRRRFAVTGNSMAPLLTEGEEVLVRPTRAGEGTFRVGDVVVLRHPDRDGFLLIKRIAEVREGPSYYVVGVASDRSTDSRVFGALPESAIVGKVTSRFA